jgi:hypothetical protein
LQSQFSIRIHPENTMQHPTFRAFAQHYLASLLEASGTVYLDEMIPRNPNLRTYKHPSRTDSSISLLRELVGNSDRIWVSPEIIAEAELVDFLFEPHQPSNLIPLGWLNELLDRPTIIQVFRHLPTSWDIRTCIRHWLSWWAEAAGTIVEVDAPPKPYESHDDLEEEETLDQAMLILLPSITSAMLKSYGARPAPEYESGIYKFPPAYAIILVVINQLPIQPMTLWLRLLGRGVVQRQAIEELIATDHPYRDRILQQFKAWKHVLQSGEAGRESSRLMQVLSQLD